MSSSGNFECNKRMSAFLDGISAKRNEKKKNEEDLFKKITQFRWIWHRIIAPIDLFMRDQLFFRFVVRIFLWVYFIFSSLAFFPSVSAFYVYVLIFFFVDRSMLFISIFLLVSFDFSENQSFDLFFRHLRTHQICCLTLTLDSSATIHHVHADF